MAFDVRMLESCRDHDWLCYSVTPELFHHISAPSEIANVNTGTDAVDGNGGATGKRKPTVNIECGARHPDMWVDPKDQNRRYWMVQQVQERGCLLERTGDAGGLDQK